MKILPIRLTLRLDNPSQKPRAPNLNNLLELQRPLPLGALGILYAPARLEQYAERAARADEAAVFRKRKVVVADGVAAPDGLGEHRGHAVGDGEALCRGDGVNVLWHGGRDGGRAGRVVLHVGVAFDVMLCVVDEGQGVFAGEGGWDGGGVCYGYCGVQHFCEVLCVMMESLMS